MTRRSSPILQVALPVPLRRHFDYLAHEDMPEKFLQPGMRVLVPFGKSTQQTGIVIGASSTSNVAMHKLKRIIKVIDHQPLFDPAHFELLRWTSEYYHYPLGELLFSTLPVALRNGKAAELPSVVVWKIRVPLNDQRPAIPVRARKQQALFDLMQLNACGLSEQELTSNFANWRGPMQALLERGLVESQSRPASTAANNHAAIKVTLNEEQQHAFDVIRSDLSSAKRFLLDGITGSGKTEIYLEVINHIVRQGKQAMLLVPEIGLTPHFIARIRERINARLVVLHSGLSDSERLQSWLEAREGCADVILGTRSAVWTPLKAPGIFIVDEEHDPSYKQQESFRYSARDIAILRSNYANVPVILGSATPSLESLHNVDLDKYKRIVVSGRVDNAVLPDYHVIDMRTRKASNPLSEPLIIAIRKVLEQKKQTLLFLNRRGYSPVLMCHHCGWVNTCSRCNLPLTYHKQRNLQICHHCGSQARPAPACPECHKAELLQIGYGTERITEVLADLFPAATILRIDRDTTRRKGSMENFVDRINSGEADILVGTQMLAKGHHFPDITLVGIIDADRGLYSADFRASERMAQLITQVSGRAGRAKDPGMVMIQTHFPAHPLLTTLLQHDYHTFARLLLQERKSVNLPPYSYMALLRAESFEQNMPVTFLHTAVTLLNNQTTELEISGPFPAPIEKRSGKYRFQLLLQSDNRMRLQKALLAWVYDLEHLPLGKKIRWSLDVDPQEML
jgi:primosomal protein N' (replication factor Y)